MCTEIWRSKVGWFWGGGNHLFIVQWKWKPIIIESYDSMAKFPVPDKHWLMAGNQGARGGVGWNCCLFTVLRCDCESPVMSLDKTSAEMFPLLLVSLNYFTINWWKILFLPKNWKLQKPFRFPLTQPLKTCQCQSLAYWPNLSPLGISRTFCRCLRSLPSGHHKVTFSNIQISRRNYSNFMRTSILTSQIIMC